MAGLSETQGTVLSGDFGAGQSAYRMQSGGYSAKTSYFPNITYQYTINGQQYTNNTYAQRPSLINNKAIIQRILNNYPVGSTVTVYYNPNNPQEAYLQKGYGGATRVILLGTLLFTVLIIGIVLAVVLATA